MSTTLEALEALREALRAGALNNALHDVGQQLQQLQQFNDASAWSRYAAALINVHAERVRDTHAGYLDQIAALADVLLELQKKRFPSPSDEPK